MEAAVKASGWEAAGYGTHAHTSGIVVDSYYRKFPRFSEGFDLRDNDTLSTCFVIHYCISYHKLSGFKQHTFIISEFLWIRSSGTLNWVLCFRVSFLTRLQLNYWPGLCPHLQAQLKKDLLPSSLKLLAEFQFLKGL